jgi:hypothetical protein
MRLLGRLLLYLLLACGLIRAVLYLVYAAAMLPTPLEAHNLEAKMVLLAWRAQHGLSLYPAWWDYPHVANIFGPVYFLGVGLLGRLLGVDIPGLFLVGRAVTFTSTLLTSLATGAWIGRRYGRGAGLAGGVLSLGSGPMYGFTVMVRPDATAELLGVAGFFLSGSRSRPWRIGGVVLLILSALTKQTAGVFLLAAALSLALEGHWRRALGVLGGGLAGLLLVVVAVNTLLEPHFARSLFGASAMPWDIRVWGSTLRTVRVATPDILFLPVVGLWLWLGDRPRDVRLAALVLVLLAASLGLTGMIGADINYYLSLRVAEALAVGTLWHAARANDGRSRLRSTALAAAAALSIVSVHPSIVAAIGQVDQAWQRVAFFEGPRGRSVLSATRAAFALAQDPDVHLLTDLALIDLYQGERAAFGDPWLFRKLVEGGLLRPTRMEEWIDKQYYDLIITNNPIDAPDYETKDFRLPMVLAERVRARYTLREAQSGLFVYGRGGAGGSSVAGPAGGLGR